LPNGRVGRGVTASAAIGAFQKLGFEIDRVRGSHYILRHPDGRRVTIPRHSIVKAGLLLDQLRKVGVPWEVFRENL
jgi:predicted RNA binding protein YcfA (HicA-like mRNA interferase family)